MCNFREALNAWLLKLGIAREGVASIPESHYGLKLTVDGRPLRSLGVGVSQVIPVIATCLVAGRGSMVLLEEPELHLNPSLQRQLADFFVAMTLPGADRQLVVETHSEYLITRLRVHAVKSKEQAKLIKLLFASQTTTLDSSFSIYQELTPDENGEIPEWPELPGHEDGYFGQVPHDIQQLLQILIERHKNSVMPE
jgi:predicted ATPase